FTPSTKAEKGHDVNISFKDVQKEIGPKLAGKIRKASLELYQKAALYAVSKGIIIADT
ncbi:MAG TPA: phosphoribosylaminoimidazolesuccinocarboxamide synthase, partial [Candidatus Aminicenantes bacterium]|nr:phosphoribosylaminoimidazolesuccinocarboxamide synthase [Candidatus Aminicenantes bacterium]